MKNDIFHCQHIDSLNIVMQYLHLKVLSLVCKIIIVFDQKFMCNLHVRCVKIICIFISSNKIHIMRDYMKLEIVKVFVMSKLLEYFF